MNTSSSIRVGVIGAGVMGERHLRTYSDLPNVAVAGVFDPDRSRATAMVERYGGRVYDSAEDLLDDVDALTIAAPTQHHARLALMAIDQKRHVLIEKPMTHTLSEAREVADAARQHPDVVVNVGHIERFNPVVQALRDGVGDRTVERATFRRTTPFHGRCLDTDVIHDLMIHDIDLSLALFGSAMGVVRSDGSVHVTGDIDEASARYTAKSGTQVTLIASRVSSWKERVIEVLTNDRWIVADLLARTVTTTSYQAASRRAEQTASSSHVTVIADGADALRSELQHFLDCVRTGAVSSVDSRAGFESMRFAHNVRSNIPERSIRPEPERTSVHA